MGRKDEGEDPPEKEGMLAQRMGVLYGSNADLAEEMEQAALETLASQQPPMALNGFIGVTQIPRFYVMKTKRDVILKCWTNKEHRTGKVEWYKSGEYNATTKAQLTNGNRIAFHTTHCKNKIQSGTLVIRNLQTEDRGVYFCRINGTWGPGTHLQVYRAFNPKNAAYRTKMKDGLMILQALLLAVFIGAVLLGKRTLMSHDSRRQSASSLPSHARHLASDSSADWPLLSSGPRNLNASPSGPESDLT
ncbi:Sodium channel protein type 4 subunit alpha A [Collichthys lucidus]|uniref:Sodium channel protein type 4 subunit alpha A n=1 Tax=Collichthys lucidus TaxID=240159 RepID=A0A4U5VMJ0_COLLU|nr:Sodium channel protein type 4 subunit alpha A [Collichthys lucidus]